MKNIRKCFGIIALAAVMAFSACGGGGGTTHLLSGNITIEPDTDVYVGTELTAVYSGTEKVSFQWKKDTLIADYGETFTPTEEGSYTVTVSAAGYVSKTSAVVTVDEGSGGSGGGGSGGGNATGAHNYQWVVTKFTAPAEETGTCSICGETATRPSNITAFYGDWKNSNNLVRTISANKVGYASASVNPAFYDITGLTVTPEINTNAATKDDYPSGYRFKGTIANKTGGNASAPNQETGETVSIVDGLVFSIIFFLHTDGGSISNNGGDGVAICIKQP